MDILFLWVQAKAFKVWRMSRLWKAFNYLVAWHRQFHFCLTMYIQLPFSICRFPLSAFRMRWYIRIDTRNGGLEHSQKNRLVLHSKERTGLALGEVI